MGYKILGTFLEIFHHFEKYPIFATVLILAIFDNFGKFESFWTAKIAAQQEIHLKTLSQPLVIISDMY